VCERRVPVRVRVEEYLSPERIFSEYAYFVILRGYHGTGVPCPDFKIVC
jgi:hypothetical protein